MPFVYKAIPEVSRTDLRTQYVQDRRRMMTKSACFERSKDPKKIQIFEPFRPVPKVTRQV